MSLALIVVTVFMLFFLLLMSAVPVAFCLGVSGGIGIWLLDGQEVMSASLASIPLTSSARYGLVVLPMFILMGVLLAETGIARDLYRTAERSVGRLPGGLAGATVFACTIFGGVSGSSTADAATIGRISIEEMRRNGYRPEYAAAVVAAAGTIAVLIPPSIILIMYGVITGESVGALLLAGLVPGCMMGLAFFAYAVTVGLRGRDRALSVHTSQLPASERHAGNGATRSRNRGDGEKNSLTNYLSLLYALVLFGVVLGGIYLGVFTSTEASAVGAATALALGVIAIRSPTRSLEMLRTAVPHAVSTVGMIFAILLGGTIFTYFLISAGVPASFTTWILEMELPSELVVIMLLATLIPLGMFLDGLSMMLVTVPLSYPVVTALGYDGVWFGVLVCVLIEVGLLTPPVGLNVFVISGLPGAPRAEQIFVQVLPFVLIQLLLVALFMLFPDLVTWLPSRAQST
ncbi:TRAP transporter large permease [Nocardioides seonyuensis]|nr:TRAP transporter large permease subunit [Nocardioides seonyuensis]